MARAAVDEADFGRVAIEIVQADVVRLIDRLQAERVTGVDQVARHLGLAVDRHGFAAAGRLQIDAVPRAAKGHLEPAMDQAFKMQPSGDADRLQKADRALLEHAGANARQHVGAILALENDRIDAVGVQQLPEQQPGRPGADDGDLRAQNASPL